MAIKHRLEIIDGVFADIYLKINDYQVNSQIEKKDEKDKGVKNFIFCCNLVFMDLKKTKNIKTEIFIFKIDDIDTFTLSKAYKKVNEKYKGELI
jgi:hypothetical protein